MAICVGFRHFILIEIARGRWVCCCADTDIWLYIVRYRYVYSSELYKQLALINLQRGGYGLKDLAIQLRLEVPTPPETRKSASDCMSYLRGNRDIHSAQKKHFAWLLFY